MDYNQFFNTYGYVPQDGWVGGKKQLNEQGMETDFYVEFGKGFIPGSAIPEPEPTTPKCLTFTAGEGGASVGFIVNNFGYELPETYTIPSLQYSTDSGKTWQDYDLQISDIPSEATLIPLDEGESVMFKGTNENLSYFFENEDTLVALQVYIDGSVAASGDITSLLNGVGGDVSVPQYCYCFMFNGCTDLTTAPALPATTLAYGCYNSMFSDCTGLTQAPVLPATTPESGCYNYMFKGCTAITSHSVATLNNSIDIFLNNTSCASLTVHAETPPEIVDITLEGLPVDCIIYVPAASVDAYKAAQYWSARADYIQAME